MNRRILIATVAALSMAGITAASAEYDSAGVGTINPERFGYHQPGNATQKYPSQSFANGYASGGYSDGYMAQGYMDQGSMAYGSADTRIRVRDGYAGPGRSYELRAQPRGNVCLDQDGYRVACR